MIRIDTEPDDSSENNMPQKFDKSNMTFWHLLSFQLLIDKWVHDVVPKRCDRQVESFIESDRKLWHFFVEIQCGKVLIGVHMVVRMPLESKDNPIVNDIVRSIPRRKLTDLFLIDILPENKPVMLDVLNYLQTHESSETHLHEKEKLIQG